MTASTAVLLKDMASIGCTLMLVSSYTHTTGPIGLSNGSQI